MDIIDAEIEVTPRFELGSRGFAIHGLTTWLCHLFISFKKEFTEER